MLDQLLSSPYISQANAFSSLSKPQMWVTWNDPNDLLACDLKSGSGQAWKATWVHTEVKLEPGVHV